MSSDTRPPAATRTSIDRGARRSRVERVIDAPPEEVFDVLADPSMHPVIDGSGVVQRTIGSNPERLARGSRFGMGMRWKLFPYPIRNVVVEFEEDRLIAWRHFGGHRWRWELEPVDGGTRVVHTFDWSTSHWPRALELLRYPEANLRSMEGTVERLDELVTDR